MLTEPSLREYALNDRIDQTALVRLLDDPHNVRFDFSTATKLLDVSKHLKERYGSLTNLLAESKTPAELSK